MREIKFRIWEKLANEWWSRINYWAPTFSNGGYSIYSDRGDTLQQFTGLFDKNGREIYEGDILKIEEWDRDDLIAKVIFCERNVGFRVATGSGVVYENFPSSRYLQVIGNIFENPELCKIEK